MTGTDVLGKGSRGMIGMASAAFTDISLSVSASNITDATSIENMLAKMMTVVGNYVSGTLANASGNGDAGLLPIQTLSTFTHGISRFFNDPYILLNQNKDNSTFQSAWNQFEVNLACYRGHHVCGDE